MAGREAGRFKKCILASHESLAAWQMAAASGQQQSITTVVAELT
jgi:hypothetical protein